MTVQINDSALDDSADMEAIEGQVSTPDKISWGLIDMEIEGRCK